MEVPDMTTQMTVQMQQQPEPPSPLTGAYLLVVVAEPHSQAHKEIILQKLTKGFLSWDSSKCHVDLEEELSALTQQAPQGEEARHGERLIQYATENLVTEILIQPQTNTLVQCMRNLLSSFTRHRHIVHAGYTFQGNGSWILQDGTFSLSDFSEAFQDGDVQRVLRAYPDTVSIDLHCASAGGWNALSERPFTRGCQLRVNPNDVLTSGSAKINAFIDYLSPMLTPTELHTLLESSDVVGNIRFSHPTLYVFPGGQGDAALFGINGFNMLVDGGFARKACFWDFARHLDRLDAVLMTRLNNSNALGLSSVINRKKSALVYPQIGHFFCNLQDKKVLQSPDGDKDRDPLMLDLLEQGQNILTDLKCLNLKPQACYKDSEPINLYHKVGHGTLDMYVLSPSKDSKEVRDFLLKWNNNDSKLFAPKKDAKEFSFPIQNLISICALLVWKPANPADNITRILFPGSTPEHKIFEGLDKIKHLEFMKHPVCSAKSLSPTGSIIGLSKQKVKSSLIEKMIPEAPLKSKLFEKDNKVADEVIKSENNVDANKLDTHTPSEVKDEIKLHKISNLNSKPKPPAKEKKVEPKKSIELTKIENGDVKDKVDKVENDKVVSKKDNKDETDTKPKPKPKIEHKSKIDTKTVSKPRTEIKTAKSTDRKTPAKVEKKPEPIKSTPTTPKKTVENGKVVNGVAKDKEIAKAAKPALKAAPKPSAVPPAKSAKEANNRKVVESKIKSTNAKKDLTSKPIEKKEPVKVERKPISRRPKATSPSSVTKTPGSPAKSAKSTPSTSVKSDKDGVVPVVKPEKESTTESSPLSTPSVEQETTRKIVESLAAAVPLDEAKLQELEDLKEEQEVIREIEAVFNRDNDAEGKVDSEADLSKVKDDSKSINTTDMEEDEEYIIIEKEEIEQFTEDSINEQESSTKEEEIQKHQRDSEESEKKRRESLENASEENDKKPEPIEIKETDSQQMAIDEQIDKDSLAEAEPKEIKVVEDSLPKKEDEEVESKQSGIKEEEAVDKPEVFQQVTDIDNKLLESTDVQKEDQDEAVVPKDHLHASPDAKLDGKKSDDKEESKITEDLHTEEVQKEHLPESQPDEKASTTIESGATTAPTLPEDERIPLDEIKEDQVVEEKYVKEETKEIEVAPSILPTKLEPLEDKGDVQVFPHNGHLRDVVKTPDEVADLPMHEEVDYGMYDDFPGSKKKKDDAEDKQLKRHYSDEKDKDEAEQERPDEELTTDIKSNDFIKQSPEDLSKPEVVEETMVPATDTKLAPQMPEEPALVDEVMAASTSAAPLDAKPVIGGKADILKDLHDIHDEIISKPTFDKATFEAISGTVTDKSSASVESHDQNKLPTDKTSEKQADDQKPGQELKKDDLIFGGFDEKKVPLPHMSSTKDLISELESQIVKDVDEVKLPVLPDVPTSPLEDKLHDISTPATTPVKDDRSSDDIAKDMGFEIEKKLDELKSISESDDKSEHKQQKEAADMKLDGQKSPLLNGEVHEEIIKPKKIKELGPETTDEKLSEEFDIQGHDMATPDFKDPLLIESMVDDVSKQDYLEETMKDLKEDIKGAGETITSGLEKSIDEAKHEFEDKVTESVEDIKDSAEAVKDSVIDELKTGKDDFITSIGDLKDDIKETMGDVKGKVEGAMKDAQEKAAEVVKDTLKGQAAEAVKNLEGVVEAVKDETIDDLDQSAKYLKHTPEAIKDELKDGFDESLSVAKDIKDTAKAIKDEFIDDFDKSLKDAKDLKDEIKDGAEIVKDALKHDIDQSVEAVNDLEDTVKYTFMDNVDKTVFTVEEGIEGKEYNTEYIRDIFIVSPMEHFNNCMKDMRKKIKEEFEKCKDFEDHIEDFEEEVEDAAKDVQDAVKDELNKPAIEDFKDDIKSTAEAIKDTVKDDVEKSKASVEDIKEEMKDTAEKVKDAVKDEISKSAAAVEDAAEKVKDAVKHEVTKSVEVVADTAEKVKDNVKDEINKSAAAVGHLAEEMKSTAETVKDALKDDLDKSKAVVEDVKAEIKSTVDVVKDTLKDDLDKSKAVAEDVKGEIKSAVDAVKDTLKDDLDKSKAVAADVKEEIMSTVDAVKDTLKDDLDKSKAVVEDVKEEIKSTVDAVKDTLKDDLDKSKAVVEDVKEEIKSTVDAVKDTLKDDLDKSKAAVDDLKEGIKGAVKDELDKSAAALENFKDDIKNKAESTKNALKDDLDKSIATAKDTADSVKESVLGGILGAVCSLKDKFVGESDKPDIKDTAELFKDDIDKFDDLLSGKGDKADDLMKEVVEKCDVVQKSPLDFQPFEVKTYTTELRETHITTLDSPIQINKVIVDLPENIENLPPKDFTGSFLDNERKFYVPEGKDEDRDEFVDQTQNIDQMPDKGEVDLEAQKTASPFVIKSEEEVIKIVSNVAEVLKSDKLLEEIIPDVDKKFASPFGSPSLSRDKTPEPGIMIDQKYMNGELEAKDESSVVADIDNIKNKDGEDTFKKCTAASDKTPEDKPTSQQSSVITDMDNIKNENGEDTFKKCTVASDKTLEDKPSSQQSSVVTGMDGIKNEDGEDMFKKCTTASDKTPEDKPSLQQSSEVTNMDQFQNEDGEDLFKKCTTPSPDKPSYEHFEAVPDMEVVQSEIEGDMFKKCSMSFEKPDEDKPNPQRKMFVTASSEDGGEETEICDKDNKEFDSNGDIFTEKTSEMIASIKIDDTKDSDNKLFDSKSTSGKTTPDIKIDDDKINTDALSGTVLPEVKSLSGKSTPDMKIDTTQDFGIKADGKQSPTQLSPPREVLTENISGRSTPDIKITYDDSVERESSGRSSPAKSGRSTPEIKISEYEDKRDFKDLSINSEDDQKGHETKFDTHTGEVDAVHSGKSTPDLQETGAMDKSSDLDQLSGKVTPPTAPISPSVKNDTFLEESKKDLQSDQSKLKEEESSSISTPELLQQSGKSSPVLITSAHGSSENITKSASSSLEHGSTTGIPTPDMSSSPKPTSPFPKVVPGKEDHLTFSGKSTPDLVKPSSGKSSPFEKLAGDLSDDERLISDLSTSKDLKAKDDFKDSTVLQEFTKVQSVILHSDAYDDRVYSDDEILESPASTSSQIAHSQDSFRYEGATIDSRKHLDSDAGLSDDFETPKFSTKMDPMSTSFYGELPTTTTIITMKSDPIAISTVKRTESEMMEAGHRFLEEADMEFEKALEEHKQLRGSELMSAITSKYEFSPSGFASPGAESFLNGKHIDETSAEFKLKDVTTKPKEGAESNGFIRDTEHQSGSTEDDIPKDFDPLTAWGKPLGLPSPAPPPTVDSNMKTTPKKEKKSITAKIKLINEKNLSKDIRRRSESPHKGGKKVNPVYIDLSYVPHHGNSYYCHVDFFKRVRARYYVFSGTEPSKDVYNALLEAKQTWEDKDLEVTIIPTYDTDVLGYWVSENEDLLIKHRIDLSPSASRCTINLQDHETSCSAYRLEF